MANVNHADLVPGSASGIHGPISWVAADSAARLALSVVAADVTSAKLCYQTDLARLYRLTNHSPMQWVQLPADDVGEWRGMIAYGNNVTSPFGLASGVTISGGTATARALATTTKGTLRSRFGYPTSAAAGQLALIRTGLALPFTAAPGYRYHQQWVMASTTSGMRWFAGIANTFSGALTAFTDCFGVGRETETNINVFYNDGIGAPSQIDLGASFAALPTANTLLDLELYFPSATSATYCLRNVETGAEVSGTVATNILAGTSNGMLQYGNVADAAVVALDLCHLKWAHCQAR